MTTMRVSVVLTTYNSAWCIERSLDSVMAQSRSPNEIVVADDGSSDDTVERIQARYGDAVRVLRLPHRGVTASRRVACETAAGPWIAFLDADDEWAPEKLERQGIFLERHPDLRWLSSDGAYVSEQGVLRESWLSEYFHPVQDIVGDLFPTLVRGCFPLMSSTVVHAEAYRAAGGFDPAFRWSQDYDLWLRLAARLPGAVLADRLVRFHSSPHQLSRRTEERRRDDLRLMRRVARGDLRRSRPLQRAASLRASALEFDLGVTCLRSGRLREGRVRLMRAAAGPGPVSRRTMALCGAVAPRWSLGRLIRSPWLRAATDRPRGYVARQARTWAHEVRG